MSCRWCRGWVERVTVPGVRPVAVGGSLRIAARGRPGGGGLWLELAWPAGFRGTAARDGGVVHHSVLHSGVGEACGCVRHACGGVTAKSWCPGHGTVAGRATEDRIEGGVSCTDRPRRMRVPART